MAVEASRLHAVDDDRDISVRAQSFRPDVDVTQVAVASVQKQHRRKRAVARRCQHAVVLTETRGQVVDG